MYENETERLALAFERSHEAWVSLDNTGAVRLANRAARDLVGETTSLELVETPRGPRVLRADGRLLGCEVERIATDDGSLLALRPPASRLARALERMVDAVFSQPDQPEILDSLKAITGDALAVDRVLVHEANLSSREGTTICEWLNPDAPGIVPWHKTYPIETFSESVGMILATRQWFESHKSAPHPAFAKEGSIATVHGEMDAKSIIVFPFAFGPTSFYVLSADQVSHERAWLPFEVDFLRAVTRIVNLAIRNRWLVETSSRAESALMEVQRLQSIRVLAGGAAHDLASFMGAIHWAVERARGIVPPTSPVVASLDDISRAARGCTDLVRQLLTYARKGQHRVQTVALGPLADDLLGLLQSVAGNSVRLTVEDRAPVEGDANQLRQVLVNLVSNAAEASAENRSTEGIQVRVGSRNDAGGSPVVAISVQDWGPGIPADVRDKIFDPFFTTKGSGRGLGLAAVARIIREHGGAVQVESEVGKGTTVTVTVPRTDDFELPPSSRAQAAG